VKTVSREREGVFGVLKEGGDLLARQATRIDYHVARILHPRVRPVLPVPVLPGCGLRALEHAAADLVNLHWVEHHFITPRELAKLAGLGIPLVWTLHDMAPLAGGFSYREAAGLDLAPYGPLVYEGPRRGPSQHILDGRVAALKGANLTVIAPSEWLAEEARRSPVFRHMRIERIPYGIDTATFQPLDRAEARRRWNLPEETRVILFGADTFDDPRKGICHLQRAVESLASHLAGGRPLLLGFGNRQALEPDLFAIESRGVGRIDDARDLVSLYSAADVFVCPSREDNLPNTMIESLACGTPVVGFQVGGLPDFVRNHQTGILAKPYDTEELGRGIRTLLELPAAESAAMRDRCRSLATQGLGLAKQATAYLAIYRELAGTSTAAGCS
jgi:glycosyltransferase involved in cell wall biosynthesis